MTLPRLRSVLAILLVAGFLTACSDILSALNIFLVRFFYAGGGASSLILPTNIRAGATAYSSCSSGSLSCANDLSTAGVSLTSSVLTAISTGNKSGVLAALMAPYTDKSQYGVNLAFGLGADNSGNTDKASFPAKAGLNLFVQEKTEANRTTTELNPFEVGAGERDTIPVTIPVKLSSLPSATFQSMLKGDSIPYFLTGKLGFDLKSPTGGVLSSHETEMDLATDKVATRPSDASVSGFLNVVSTYVK